MTKPTATIETLPCTVSCGGTMSFEHAGTRSLTHRCNKCDARHVSIVRRHVADAAFAAQMSGVSA
jgi:hypothetical protein